MNDPIHSEPHLSHSFGALYQPLHHAIRMHPIYDIRQKPVLITRLGTTTQTEKRKWIADALSIIEERYGEIKGIVFSEEQ